jgi:hypothetical protein
MLKLWRRRRSARAGKGTGVDRGFMSFSQTSEVIRAETVIAEAGFTVRVMAPPPEVRTGCDLVIEFPLIEQLNILHLIGAAGLTPLAVVPVDDPLLEPVSLFQVKDFGDYLMVRAANMKLTVEVRTRVIVNVSGGGCPDVPYLARELVGKRIDEAPPPRRLGHTLCGYALQLAFDQMVARCSP